MKKRTPVLAHPKIERIRVINSDLDSYMKGLRTRETDKKANVSFIKKLLSRKPKKEQFVEVELEVVPAQEKPAKVIFNEQLDAPQKQSSPFAFLSKLFKKEPEDIPVEKLPVFEEKITELSEDEEVEVEEPELKVKHQSNFKKIIAKHARKIPAEIFDEEPPSPRMKEQVSTKIEYAAREEMLQTKTATPLLHEEIAPKEDTISSKKESAEPKKDTLLESISSWMHHRDTKHQEKEEKFKEEVTQEIEKKELKAPSRIRAAHEHMAELEEEFKKDLAEFDKMEDEMKEIDKKHKSNV